MATKFKNINDCLSKKVRQRIALSDQLTCSARQHLPEPLAAHCWVSGYENDVIKLVTDEAAFATPIQYRQKALLQYLNAEFAKTLGVHFRKTEIRVARFPIIAGVSR